MVRSKSHNPNSIYVEEIGNGGASENLPQNEKIKKCCLFFILAVETKRGLSMGKYSYINYKNSSKAEKKELLETFRKLSIDVNLLMIEI